MNDETADILVLRSDTHGLPAKDYADRLSQRLPTHRVHLARTSSDERDLIERADVVTGVDIDESLLEYAENLRLFAGVAAGYNHLPLEAFSEMGVTVTNASGIHAPNIAEQVLGYVLSFSRRLREGWEREKRHEWRHFQAEELKDSTVTVVGLGAIGTAIVDRFAGFDVHTIGVRYTPEKGGPTDEVIGFEREAFHDAVSRTDYLLIAAPLSDTTRGLVSEEEFKTLPPNARVVNVGRGRIIDTDALVSAIQKNQINGAALDVTDPEPLPADHPLWRFENVTITPHNAGHSPKHWDRLAEIVASNVNRLAETNRGEELENVVRS
ncbi:hydroxyacid dehydrogenase [Haladaptatus sp. R4]|uniref:D-2-hydroxyacid dehydrogenase n=1 Tax=Haladaptatus sp. R4 TaxID=1679489 RepID=UPI0007B4D2E8|nr:D-2-hydroxyacid dehydrogenase [Haladaptatus sp. R4]KZN23238.1 hydroxyacid dehydrogenase [Haladaptatus sp. R4]